MPDPDPISLLREAAEETAERYKATVRRIRDEEVQQPLIGKRKTKQERDAAFLEMVAEPGMARLLGAQDQLGARYDLPPDKPVPKRLAEYLDRMFKEVAPSG